MQSLQNTNSFAYLQFPLQEDLQVLWVLLVLWVLQDQLDLRCRANLLAPGGLEYHSGRADLSDQEDL